MTPHILCLAAVLAAGPDDARTVYRPSDHFLTAVRGQTPPYDEVPYEEIPSPQDQAGGNTYGGQASPQLQPPTTSPGYPAQPYGQPPMAQDPFLGPPGMSSGRPQAGGYSFGTHGPQPYRFGWTSRGNVSFIPKVDTDSPLGQFGIFGTNAEFEHTVPLGPGWIFSTTHQFGLRTWDGPAGIGLPGSVFRFGWDFSLATPANGPWSIQVNFNPSLNSDFERSLTSDAWNLDAWGMIFYRPHPMWTWVIGAGFWDRVDDRVIPYAGAIWRPTDRWEWRILFPKSRISYFLGNSWCGATWAYLRGEYHSEAYEIEVRGPDRQEQIELDDWRLLLGLRSDHGRFASFLEAGWVFGRDVEFAGPTPGFDVDTGFIGRLGLRF